MGCLIGSVIRTAYHIYLVSGKIIRRKLAGSILITVSNLVLFGAGFGLSTRVLRLLVPGGTYTSFFTWIVSAVAVFAISAIIIFGGDILTYKLFTSKRRN